MEEVVEMVALTFQSLGFADYCKNRRLCETCVERAMGKFATKLKIELTYYLEHLSCFLFHESGEIKKISSPSSVYLRFGLQRTMHGNGHIFAGGTKATWSGKAWTHVWLSTGGSLTQHYYKRFCFLLG